VSASSPDLDRSIFDRQLSIDEVRALASNDLAFYTSLMYPKFRAAEHHKHICDVLNDVTVGKKKRVIITLPPRHGKSILASQHFPAFYIGRHPDREIICATYSQDKADDWGREVRNQVIDPIYGVVFPGVTLRKDSTAARRFKTPQQGGYFAAGRNSPMTGRGASCLIIDDILKGDEEADSLRIREKVKNWWGSVAYTRLTPDGAVVLIGTRWHTDDLIGFVTREHADEGWEIIDYPAISASGEALWPDRFPVEHLRKIRRALTDRHWNALYQQQPYTEEGAIIKRHFWRPWLRPLDSTLPEFIVISLDTAYTKEKQNDRTACTVWWVVRGEDERARFLLRYAWAERLEFNDLMVKLEDTVAHFGRGGVPVRVLIEAKASGLSVIQELRRRKPELNVVEVPATTDKFARAYSVQTFMEHGTVCAVARMEPRGVVDTALQQAFPGREDDRAEEPVFRPWAQECVDECAVFPRGRHDDYLDSVTHALRHLRDLGFELFVEDDPSPVIPQGSADPNGIVLY